MLRRMPAGCRELLELQAGTISRQQAQDVGMTRDEVRHLVRRGRWQMLQRGVYAAFSGKASREAELWAAVLRAGSAAVLSHETAAEVQGLSAEPSSLIHVTIPEARRVEPVPGIVIHRSGRVQEARHPVLLPPRTRIEETVLDLVQLATTFDRAFAWVAAACQRRLTRADLIAIAMDDRKKLRWRAELAEALGDVGKGVHTPLEFRYVRGVERPHGLPEARRQARVTRERRNSYLDNYYDKYDLLVELDGAIAHPDYQRWADKRRDNAALADGLATLRYGWLDCTTWRCRTAHQVGTALLGRGWPGPLRPCGPGCSMITEISRRIAP